MHAWGRYHAPDGIWVLDAEVRASVRRGSPRCVLLLCAATTTAVILVAALVNFLVCCTRTLAAPAATAPQNVSVPPPHTSRCPRPLSCAAHEQARVCA